MQDALALPVHGDQAARAGRPPGTWTLFQSGDRMYSSKQAPFLVTETNAQAIGASGRSMPGVRRPVAAGRVGARLPRRRDDRVLALAHHRTSAPRPTGVGVLPHDQRPGRVYRELAQLGAELAAAGSAVVGLTPDAQVGMVYSTRSKWGLAGQAPFSATDAGGDLDERSYQRIFEAYYRGTFDAGVSTRILHDDQLVSATGGLDPAAVAAELPVLVAPGLLVADDQLLTWLRSTPKPAGTSCSGSGRPTVTRRAGPAPR